LPPRPGVTWANFERIEDGMTQEEVEKILGGPGVDWLSPGRGVRVTYFIWDHPYDRTQVFVGFRDNHVIQKEWGGPPDTFMQKLKRWFRLGRPPHCVAESRDLQARRAMTKKRWIVLTGMLAACVYLTLAVLALLPPRPGVTPANIERIEAG